MSRIWLMSMSRLRPCFSIVIIFFRLSSSRFFLSFAMSWLRPRISVSGVRNSWVMLVKKFSFIFMYRCCMANDFRLAFSVYAIISVMPSSSMAAAASILFCILCSFRCCSFSILSFSFCLWFRSLCSFSISKRFLAFIVLSSMLFALA